jgi:hypothetical protein
MRETMGSIRLRYKQKGQGPWSKAARRITLVRPVLIGMDQRRRCGQCQWRYIEQAADTFEQYARVLDEVPKEETEQLDARAE